MKKRKSMRSSKVAALVLIVGATALVSVSVSLARAASDCPTSVTVSDWGENSTGYFNVASGGSCLFPIRMAGAVSSSEISQKPAHGKLKKLNISTYEYTAKARAILLPSKQRVRGRQSRSRNSAQGDKWSF